MRPELFRLPGLGWPVYAYPTLVAIGFAAAIAAAIRLCRRRGIDPVLPLDIGLIALVSSLLGAHLFYYVEFYSVHFANRPWWAALAFWEGGLVFYGGVIAAFASGAVYLWWYNRRTAAAGGRPVALGEMADVAAVALPLGLAFGRVGCFLNGCCWGRTCTLPWPLAVRFPRDSLAWQRQLERGLLEPAAAHTHPVYATQLYAALAAALLFAFLWRYWQRRPAPGRVLAALLALYAPIRFANESLRSHHPSAEMTRLFGGLALTWSQLVSVALFGAGLLLWVAAGALARRRHAQPETQTRVSPTPKNFPPRALDTSAPGD